MPTSQTYNPVKVRVQLDDKTLVKLDGPDEVFAYFDDALHYLDKAFDPEGYVPELRGVPATRKTRFVIIPATVS